jgi:AcrR family transcriptional regulator
LTWTLVQLSDERVTTRMPVADRRTQLVDAALDVAAHEGIAATTVRRVADRAGVALGVVHYCFADKDELFAALAARIVDSLADAGAAGLQFDDPPDLATALDAAVSALWQTIEATRGEQLLTYEITTHALRNRELRSVAERQYAVAQQAVEQVLELAAAVSGATGTMPVPELAAETLAFVDGVTLRWLVDGDSAAAQGRLASFGAFLATHARRRRGRVRTLAR